MNDLATRLAELSPEQQTRLAQTIRQQPGTFNAFPVSFAQERLWFLDQLAPGLPLYSVPIAVHLSGSLQVAAFSSGLNALIQRHESLRTTFLAIDGEPIQVVAPTLQIALPVVSLMHVLSSEQAAQVQRLAVEAAQQPFDLAQGPLVRATLFQIAPTEHVCLLLLHHIICDGWSLGVLLRDLAACYDAALASRAPTLPELPIQYADYAVWQRQALRDAVLERHLSYWRQQLGEAPTLLELPTDYPRPTSLAFPGAAHRFELTPEVVAGLHALSRQAGVTLFMTLLAAFQTLLLHYTEQTDLLIGTPIAGRRRVETEGLIGCFVNTLVLRADLSGDPGFRALLQRVRTTTLQAYAHQDLPFERLVAELQPERSLHYAPLIQVMFVLHNMPLPPLELPGLTMRRLPVSTGAVQYDLTLKLEEADHALAGEIEYRSDLFTVETIRRMAGHFQTVLSALLADPDRRIAEVALLTKAERQQLLVDWNATQAAFPQSRCLHQLVEAQAARAPAAIAVVCHDQRLTYRELNERANQLAHHLRRLGVGGRPQGEVPVGVYLHRSPDLIVALLGILKAGGAYVPLDPVYPAERIRFMLEDAGMPVLLTEERLSGGIAVQGVQIVRVDADWERIAQERADDLSGDVTPENLAYVIYTSGSTGRPKGVSCHHAGVVNLLSDFTGRQPIMAGDACSCWTSVSFDVSVYEIWSALIAGGALHLVPDDVRADGPAFLAWLATHRIRSAYVPPFLVQDLASRLDQTAASFALHRLLVGVEPIPERLLAAISHRLPELRIINGYGPTEATICATLYDVPPGSTRAGFTPIGRPVQNSEIYLLNRHLQPVPVGMIGEVYIGGVGLAYGYLNQPALTAERFIPHPFGQPGRRLYRTGDRARYLPDGNIEFLGRSDHQIKLRGFRVEPGEIEAALRQHEAVRDVVVMVREDRPGDKRLVAYVVEQRAGAMLVPFEHGRTSEQTDNREPGTPTSELRTYLKDRLPDYMVPSAFVFLDALPLAPSGKVDRRALPMPEATRDATQTFVAPRTSVEIDIAGIWSEVLSVAQIGIHDNFFDLGGHSLLATQAIARLRARFQVELPVRALFEAPTIAELAVAIVQRQAAQLDQAVLAQMLAELNELSPDAVRALLSGDAPGDV
ncbi:MAG TPA: amino acid adenylation domain-containing protein [Herpetosiphonaceae bacterium]